ncbi:Mfs1.2 [Trametopsis cervina]|nr:Mfs1.2 [Trametopsis cervina]
MSQCSAPHELPASSKETASSRSTHSITATSPTIGTKSVPKDFRFWMVFLAICVSLFLSALEFTVISTALPTIIHDLEGIEFVWVSSAYALASTALLPASGGFAQIFGRRTTMLISLAIFALGSALCGAAKSLAWLIAARTIQGAGGGGILALSSIIVSDMVSLEERGTYNGCIGMTWAVASSIGPIVGGSFSAAGQWRWLFYLNLPLCGVAAALVLVFLKLPTPPGAFKEKISRIDWIGNILIIASSSAVIIALAWGGVTFPWVSVHVLLPLLCGVVGMAAFLLYEAFGAKEPIVPYSLLTNRTSLSGYIQTFLSPLIVVTNIFFIPVYYQACKEASPVHSGVLMLGMCISLGPVLILTGASVTVSKRYRPQLWFGWAALTVAQGALSTLEADTSSSHGIGLPMLIALGGGMIYAGTYFPVLAPLPVTQNAYALAFFSFCRSLAGAWGVSIGTAVLQTQLTHRLPAEFLAEFPQGVSLAYSVIPVIKTLDEPLRSQVRDAFAKSIVVIWQVLIGISGLGFLVSLLMKGLPLHSALDEKWAIDMNETAREARDVE